MYQLRYTLPTSPSPEERVARSSSDEGRKGKEKRLTQIRSSAPANINTWILVNKSGKRVTLGRECGV